MKKLFTAFAATAICAAMNAQNPYMPLWEHIPDGEPHVYDDPDLPGHQRIYVYGSHDNRITDYCGLDQVVWSAPVEDLTHWRYDGICFKSQFAKNGAPLAPDSVADVLFAPDIVETVENGHKVYYFCPNNQAEGRKNMIAKGNRPDGPFQVCNWNEDGRSTFGVFQFDPAIFRDDDGKVYGYWGFNRSYAAELDPATMCTVKPGTKIVEDMVSGRMQEGDFRFFEASSMRKINGKYVFIYSRFTKDGEFGLPTSNYTLAYAYSNNPLGPFTYGGTLIDGRARGKDEKGNIIPTATKAGNTHGSMAQINGKWYVFYHRQTGTLEYSRQAMVAPVDVKMQGDKLIISEGEYNSEGFYTNGLDPMRRWPAGIACYYTGPAPMKQDYPHFYYTGSYPAATYSGDNGMDASYSLNMHHAPMVNNTAGSVIGYKYFNFNVLGKKKQAELCLGMKPLAPEGEIVFMIDSPWESKGGRVIGRLQLNKEMNGKDTEYVVPVNGLQGTKGKHALYMRFNSSVQGQSLCDFYDLMFR